MDIKTTGMLLVNDEIKKRLILVNKIFTNPQNESDIVLKKAVLLQLMNMHITLYDKLFEISKKNSR